MNLFTIGALLNGILILFIGFLVFSKNIKKSENQLFGLLSLSLAFWLLNFGFWQLSHTEVSALFFIRLLMIGTIFAPIFYLHFVLIFLNLISEKRKFLFFGYLITSIFLILNFTPLMVANIRSILYFPYWPVGGMAFHFWLFWTLFVVGYGMYLLLQNLQKTKGVKKEQIKYVLLAYLIILVGGVSVMPLWYGIPFPPVGVLILFLNPLILSYAILRYRFMDIRFILGRSAIYLLSFISVIILALLLLFLNNKLIQPIPVNIISSLILIIGILIFQPIYRFFEKLASKYFYYTFYSYQAVLTNLGKKLTQFLDLDKLSSLIVGTLIDTMKLERTVILLRKPGDGEYHIQKNIGFKEENGISLVKDNFLTLWLEKTKKPLVYEELALIIKDKTQKEEKTKLENLQESMKRIEAALCLPLLSEEKIIGMIVLGNKISNEPYSTQDIELLTTLSNQASIALQNAKLYNEVKGFNIRLENEVERATRELKDAYEELKRLDKAKSEFISIASHQLRTPLTAIKGYLSMILERTYGKFPQKMEKPIENMFASNERLIKLVNDLLNVSRIEAGRMEVKFESLQVEDIIQGVIDELGNIAKNKNLALIWEKPKKPLPKISADEHKIRQVVINVVDNGIRYTEKGEVRIKTILEDSKIKIVVSDTGVGLTKEEISDMFESFSRGGAGNRLHTEGVGLGLYVAKKFVEMNNGKIWAESKGKGSGSTFYIELPIK